MEDACTQALAHNVYSYTYFATLIENLRRAQPVIHENLRGKDYYKAPTGCQALAECREDSHVE